MSSQVPEGVGGGEKHHQYHVSLRVVGVLLPG